MSHRQPETISRRRTLQLLAGTAVGVGLSAACAPIIRTPPSGPTTAAAPSSGTARAGGTLVYGQLAPVLNTLPYPSNPSTNLLRSMLFNPLVTLDERKQPVPELAESWSFSDDRLTLTLNLRHGVTFHSGHPFTADEAKWNIEYAQDPKNGAQAGSQLKAVTPRAIDARTLELQLPDVMPHILTLLADVPIMDPLSDIAVSAAGTGPFKLDGLTPGVEVQLVRNTGYWRADRPNLDRVDLKILPDASSAMLNLESGAVGMVQVRDSDVQQLRAAGGLGVFVAPGAGSYEVLLNTADPPLNDKRVRQAIDLALDRKRFARSLLYGLAAPTYIMWPKTSPVWDASIDTGEFNLEKARQLLVEAGYPNGFQTKIQASNAYPEEVQFDQILQADLARIGITATVEVLEQTQEAALLNQAKFPALLTAVYSYADSDPAMAFTAFPFRPDANAGRFQSDEYVRLVDSARREPAPDKRLSLYRQLALFVKDQAFVLPLANFVSCFGMQSNVHGITRQALVSLPTLENVWLS